MLRRVGARSRRPLADALPRPTSVLRELRFAVTGDAGAVYELQQVLRRNDELRVGDRPVERGQSSKTRRTSTYLVMSRLPSVVTTLPKLLAAQLASPDANPAAEEV